MSTNRPDVVVVVPVVAAANPRDGSRGAERGVEGGACMPFAHPRGLVAARGRRRRGRGGEGGEGRWRNSPDAICINEPPRQWCTLDELCT